MGGRDGGTKIYCPHCEAITVCRAISPGVLTEERGQRLHFTEHEDINFFRRGRECLECGYEFLTAEVDEEFLQELIELRDALKDIKENAEGYQEGAKAAARSLKRLTSSLNVLKALKSCPSALPTVSLTASRA